jgi:hypothetical protein
LTLIAIAAFVAVGVVPATLALHLGLAAVAGTSNNYERARSCKECCFSNKQDSACANRLWGWLFVSRLSRKRSLAAALCPFCYNRLSTDPARAEPAVIKAYLRAAGTFLLAGIPIFLGALWAALKLKGD